MSNLDLLFLADTMRPPAGKGRRDRGGKMAAAAVLLASRPGRSPAGQADGRGAATSPRTKLERITKQAPEVMVKVSGRQRGGAHTAAHLEYIGRHGKLDVETSEGRTIETVAELRELAREWAEDEEEVSRRREPLTSVSMVLSMPPGTDPDMVYQAAKAFARTELEHFPYAMALHTDEAHPHVHLTVAARGDGGVRFNPRKADLAEWREAFARELRERGIDAEATPRRARGIVQKRERIAIRKIEDRTEAGGERSRVVQGRRTRAEAMAREIKPVPLAWEVQTVVRQSAIRASYQKAAELLDRGDDDDRDLARRTRTFLEAMPSPVTRDREQSQLIARDGRARTVRDQVQDDSHTSEPAGRAKSNNRDRSL